MKERTRSSDKWWMIAKTTNQVWRAITEITFVMKDTCINVVIYFYIKTLYFYSKYLKSDIGISLIWIMKGKIYYFNIDHAPSGTKLWKAIRFIVENLYSYTSSILEKICIFGVFLLELQIPCHFHSDSTNSC